MKNYRLVFEPTADNYARLLSSPTFWSAFQGSLLSAAAASILTGLFAFPITVFLVLRSSRSVRFAVVGLLLLPMLTNSIVRAYALKLILASNGILNFLLLKINFIEQPLRLLYTAPAMFVSYILYFASVAVLAQWAGAGRLSRTDLDVAADLGAGWFRRLIKIILPLCARVIALQMAVMFAFAFSDIVVPQVIGGNRIYTLASLLIDYFKVNDWPLAAATGMVMVVIVVPVLIFCLVLGVRLSRESAWLSEQ